MPCVSNARPAESYCALNDMLACLNNEADAGLKDALIATVL